MSVVFLASYPRSGNTWARVLLYHALGGAGAQPSTRRIAERFPDLHVPGEADAGLAAHPGGRVVIKTHLPWSAGHPHAARAGASILLVRNPRDVLLSCLNFHRVLETKVKDRRTGRDAPMQPIDYARHFIAQGGDPVWMHEGFATWADNCRSWLVTPFPNLVVRYEDMLDDPGAQLARMLKHLGESPDPALIARAVGASSFEQMRAMEVREKAGAPTKNPFFGGTGKTIRKGIYFMDKARRGSRLEEIAPGLDDAFDARFGEAMGEFGYA